MTTATTSMETLRQQLQAEVAARARELNVPGIAAGIYIDGEEQYVFHGVTSVENPLEVNAETLFQIGSTTKTFTATAMMRLVEQGSVSLSDPVRRYVPELKTRDPSVAERITVLQLLNHTAGWVGDHFADTGYGDDAHARFAATLADIDQVTPLGAVFSYNNSAVRLAGHVIEKVTGKPYETAMKELIFEPLGLENTFFGPNDVITRRFAVGHQNNDDGTVTVARGWMLLRSQHPSGGIISTAGDQIRYARFHLGDGTGKDGARVLAKETLDLMKQPTFPIGGGALGDHVGLTWLMRDVDGVRLVGHGGTTNGQLSAFQLVPERDFAVTILTNSTGGGQLHRDILSWVLDRYLGLKQPEPEPLALSDAALAEYTGEYESAMTVLTLRADAGRLMGETRFTAAAEQRFQDQNPGARPPQPPPVTLAVVGKDLLLALDGPTKGLRASIYRGEDGAVKGINFGGRVVLKKD
jgi:CubicO group peptidase (beta-lactamase class C family)